MGDERDSVCSFCGVVNRRKKLIRCNTCGVPLPPLMCRPHQRASLGLWEVELRECRGVARVPTRAETPPIDLVGYIGRCHHSLRVLNRIPKRAVTPVAEALQHLIREALDRGSELAWGRLLSFSYWGLRCPGEFGGGLSFNAKMYTYTEALFLNQSFRGSARYALSGGNLFVQK